MTASPLIRARLNIFERSLHLLDSLTARAGQTAPTAPHLATGIRGEDAAYFYLRRLGYTIVARRWRSPKQRGDLDLIGWDGEWLCFIEVKTRSSRTVEPAEAAVDADKRTTLRRVAHEYVRLLNGAPAIPSRFDVVSVYLEKNKPAAFEIFRGAFDWK